MTPLSREILEQRRKENEEARAAGTEPATLPAQKAKRSSAGNRLQHRTGTLVIRLPMPPNLTNPRRRGHWAGLHNQKQKYYSVCDLMLKAKLLPPAPPKPFERVVLSSVMYLGHAMDDDNALARHKWALDWLKTRGYVVEDTRKVIRWAGLPEQVVGRKQEYALEITVTEEKAA